MQNNEGLFSLDQDPTLKSARFLASSSFFIGDSEGFVDLLLNAK